MLSALLRNLCVAAVFGVAFIINPAWVTGCASADEGPDFSEADMVALLEDFNAMSTAEIEQDDAVYEVELTLAQTEGDDTVVSRQAALFTNKAYACGRNTFMKSASACDTQTIMVVEGTLSVRRVDGDEPVVVVADLPVEGEMRASGNHLTYVDIYVELEGGSAGWSTQNGMDFGLVWFDADGLGDDGVDIEYALVTTAE
jgi:hypothetical protein